MLSGGMGGFGATLAVLRGKGLSWRSRLGHGPAVVWLSAFGASLILFMVRLMLPTPVGQADNHDGPRLMCWLGLGPVVTPGYSRWYLYAYFQYVPHQACADVPRYPSSELVPLELTRLLMPLLGLPGTLNLVALGVLNCAIASFAIASLATGLRLRPWAQLAVAAAAWLIMADAAFFDVYASPFSEPAALLGLLLVAAGVVYLGRGWRATAFGLVLAGSGGFLAILAKEQYLALAVPICLTLALANATRGRRRWPCWPRTRQAGAAVAVAAFLATMTVGYAIWDNVSRYGARLHHEQAVDMIFTDIVTSDRNAPAALGALGLPASWEKYAGHDYWDSVSVRHDPLFSRYAGQLTDVNIAQFLLTHPGSILGVGQHAAILAQHFRVTTLGNYPPSAGQPPGASETRVVALTWLMHLLPPGWGLWWLIPLWAAMVAVGVGSLPRRRGTGWQRDGGILVLSMTACAVAAFIPPAYFAGISTTRHMVGMNVATALAFSVSVALAASMIHRLLARHRCPSPAPAGGPGRAS
jgi:hypothetical protein